MKNNYLFKVFFALLLCVCTLSIRSQDTKVLIGEVRNGTAILTNEIAATKLLKANLSASALLLNIKLEFSEFDGTYFLTAQVKNDKVSSIGVQLGQDNAALFSGPGIGVEVTCHGKNCGDCRLYLSKLRPKCKCFEPTAPDYACDMTQKAVFNLGF